MKEKMLNNQIFMNRYINALFTKHKKKHLPKFLQGTWFDEWMSYGYITFITSFILQGMLYANWSDNVIKNIHKREIESKR